MILYFAVLLLMFVPLAVTGQYLFAAIELAVALLVMGIYQWDAHRRRRALAKFISENDELLRRAKDGDLPFPILIVRLSDGALAWYNKRFSKLTGVRDTLRPQSVAEVLPGLKTDWLLDGRDTAPGELEYRGRRYLVSGTMLSGAEEQSGAVYGMLFLRDLTDLLQVRDEYIRSRPILAIVLIDNYDELTNNLSDAAVSSLSAALDTCVSEWADRYGGLLRRQNYNRFLLMLEAKDLVAISADRFSLLESVRSVTNPTGVAATVSIAIGKDGADYREDYACSSWGTAWPTSTPSALRRASAASAAPRRKRSTSSSIPRSTPPGRCSSCCARCRNTGSASSAGRTPCCWPTPRACSSWSTRTAPIRSNASRCSSRCAAWS